MCRLAMETLGESGDVLDVSMEYAGRGMRGRGRPGAAEMTWDGLEPVSNTALDEFAPMEEVADDEIDYRVRANELVRPPPPRSSQIKTCEGEQVHTLSLCSFAIATTCPQALCLWLSALVSCRFL
jgi:hypothetical protein